MSPERMALLGELLTEARATIGSRDGNIVDKVAFAPMVAFKPNVIVELLIFEYLGGSVLLHLRKDQFKDDGAWAQNGQGGWHTIGGWVLPGEPIRNACIRHAKSMGIDVRPISDENFGYREDLCHPYGTNGLGDLRHLYFACELISPVKETGELKWFDHMPDKMLRGHEKHLEKYWKKFGKK